MMRPLSVLVTEIMKVHCPDRFRRKNISRAIRAAAERMAIRVGRRWPHDVLWRLRP
jgi:hypothetical protein